MKLKTTILFSIILAVSCQKNEPEIQTKSQEKQEEIKPTPTPEPAPTPPVEVAPPAQEPENLSEKEKFFRKMVNAIIRGEEAVDVSEFNLSETEKISGSDYIYAQNEKYKVWFDELKKQYPYLFHLSYMGEYSRRMKSENPDQIQFYNLEYSQKNQREQNYKIIAESLERFYSQLDAEMSVADIAYSIHNQLVKEVVYKESLLSHQPAGPLVEKKAVCEGYSFGYRMLMNLLGIETQSVISGVIPKLGQAHLWNRIKIDGQWYNIDATWDDQPYAVPFTLGQYFLTSDAVFHGKWNHPRPLEYYQIPAANSTRFDGADVAFFRNNEKQSDAVFRGGFWYFLDKNTREIKRAKIGEKAQKVYEISQKMYKSERRVAFGAEKIYFVDFDFSKNQNAVFSVDYQGKNLKAEKYIGPEETTKVSLKTENDNPKRSASGVVALRVEMALTRFKDLYYHGDEDYFEPTTPERKELLKTLKEAEKLLEQSPENQSQAENFSKKLQTLRKSINKTFSGKM